jgi:hypothetical protein
MSLDILKDVSVLLPLSCWIIDMSTVHTNTPISVKL